MIARTDAAATIHRHARMLCVCVRPPGTGLEYRFVGLLGSAAYRESVFAIPVLADRATEVLELSGAPLHSHTGRAIKHVVETLPRDLVFELDADTLAQLVIDIVGLQERRIVRAFDVAEPVGPWTTVLVYVPRSRFTATLPDEVAALVAEHYGGDVRDAETLVGTSSLARMSMSVRAKHDVDLERLAHAIDRISETWDEQTRRAAIDALGPGEGERIFDLVAGSTTAEYRARNRPADAVADFRQVATLLASGSITTSFGRAVDAEGDDWRFRVYFRGPGATLAELVPILGQLGLQAVEEHPVTFDIAGEPVSLYEIGVRAGRDHIDDLQRMELRRAFVGLVLGTIERDELNHLILDGALEIRQVGVLRLYHRYLRQVGFRFSASYIAHTLVRQSAIARLLVELFDARFDPALGTDTVARAAAAGEIRALLLERLDAVPSLDEDRICRAFLTLIDATARTNAFRSRWQVGDEIAVKLRPSDIPFLPEPRPQFEIFVCSPKVEGVHLRGGPIARGGLRWSDRAEDFRTEILGLMKAQMVKNAVIVPVGAKGGFVVKGSTAAPTDRDAVREEGIDRYRRFVRAMLDVTDNVVDGVVVSPLDCMSTTSPIRTSSWRRTRARRRSATSPTRSPSSTASGSAMRSPRAGAMASTTSRWASRPVARGRACAGTVASSASTSTVTRSPWWASGTCPVTCSATACCCRTTCGSSPRSTIGTSSSIPIRRVLWRTPNADACSNSHVRVGPTTTRRSSHPAEGCTRGRPSRSRSPTRCAGPSASTRASKRCAPTT